ncbi:MAG TPA: hypothetical protein EYG97_00950 [Arcobacter sp.]|nr:hypothetical protein [Arcobacter sp.]HIP55571.1 hypothetical protein [Arcobacter sp.]
MSENNIKFSLSSEILEELNAYSEILKKDHSQILKEALEHYFEEQQKILLEKNLEDENAMTNLGFNEFWDDLDI